MKFARSDFVDRPATITRRRQELEKDERERLELLFECAPELKQAHQLRDGLTAIFETEQSKESGQAAIEDWQRSFENDTAGS